MTPPIFTPTRFVLAALLGIAGPAFTQDSAVGIAPQPIERIEVGTADSVTASELYSRAKRWFVDTFKDANAVVKLDDPANATIVGKGSFPYISKIFRGACQREGWIDYTIEVAAKDGRYRVRMYDFIHRGKYCPNIGSAVDIGLLYDMPGCNPQYESEGAKHAARVCAEEVRPLLEAHDLLILRSLKGAMTGSGSTKGGSDW